MGFVPGHSGKAPSRNQEVSPHQTLNLLAPRSASVLILSFLASSTVRKKNAVVYKPLSLWYFVITVQVNQDIYLDYKWIFLILFLNCYYPNKPEDYLGLAPYLLFIAVYKVISYHYLQLQLLPFI